MNKLLLFLLVLLLVPGVFALGVTPGRTTFLYEPGKTQTVEFSVINSEAKDMNIVILVQGALNQSVFLSENSFAMSASETEHKLKYTFATPTDLKPGNHVTDVLVIELPSKTGSSQAYVGASVAVSTQIYISVPYPGKYAEADLNVFPDDSKGIISFVIPVISKGDLDLARVRGTVDIYSSLNEKIATIGTNEISVASQQRGEIVATWTPDVAPGPYRAVASVIYDEQVATVEKEFSVGSATLELQQIEVNNFNLGQIAKFEMLVENKWSQPIVGAYAQMIIYNANKETMADFKSQTYDIPALSKAVMVGFWDTSGVKPGTYDSSVFLKYGAQSVQRDVQLEVSNDKINVVGIGYVIAPQENSGGGSLTVILVVVIGLLVLINLAWFLFMRKKLSKK